jgi:hypothetical protein
MSTKADPHRPPRQHLVRLRRPGLRRRRDRGHPL